MNTRAVLHLNNVLDDRTEVNDVDSACWGLSVRLSEEKNDAVK